MAQLGLPLPPPVGAQAARHDHADGANQPEMPPRFCFLVQIKSRFPTVNPDAAPAWAQFLPLAALARTSPPAPPMTTATRRPGRPMGRTSQTRLESSRARLPPEGPIRRRQITALRPTRR